jgi:pectate lyase
MAWVSVVSRVGLLLLLPGACVAAAPLAFPTAEGHGRFAKGGRGGKVHVVSTLADSGAGSLRACLEATGPRTCVFAVSGTIETMRPIFVRNGQVTVAGQTSPGGIQIKVADQPVDGRIPVDFIDTGDIVIRHVRFRPGYDRTNPAFRRASLSGVTFERVHDVIVDHVSTAWTADQAITFFQGAVAVTIQDSLFAEGLAGHAYGPLLCSDAHRKGCGSITFLRNLVHGFTRRSPSIKTAGSAVGAIDVINNVVSNPGQVGMEVWDDHGGTWTNIVGNVGKRGAMTRESAALVNEGDLTPMANVWYAVDNLVTGQPLYAANNGSIGPAADPTRGTPVAPLSAQPLPAIEVFDRVLAMAGAWPRDALDARYVREARETTGSAVSPLNGGPWPRLASPSTPADLDRDGMLDGWEQASGLDPADPRDRNAIGANGYTQLELYLQARHCEVMSQPRQGG